LAELTYLPINSFDLTGGGGHDGWLKQEQCVIGILFDSRKR
jgi:hypothetical protein